MVSYHQTEKKISKVLIPKGTAKEVRNVHLDKHLGKMLKRKTNLIKSCKNVQKKELRELQANKKSLRI